MDEEERRAAQRLKRKGLVEIQRPDITGVDTAYMLTQEGRDELDLLEFES
jgi:hypothetical protein